MHVPVFKENQRAYFSDHRYPPQRCAARPVDDNEEIIPPPLQAAANRLVQSAGMLCREQKFQKWLVDSGCGDEISEESASKYLRRLLGINSRRQIAEEDHVARHFGQIRNIYESGQLLGAPDNAQVVF